MSISLAQTWIRSKVAAPEAQKDALRLIETAAEKGAEATLVVGSHLTSNGGCYLCRWDSRELVVLELAPQVQRGWELNPKSLFQQIETPGDLGHVVASERLFSLSISRVEKHGEKNGTTFLSGTYIAERSSFSSPSNGTCALQAEYFQPKMPCRLTQMSYANHDIPLPRMELPFRFSPVQTSRGEPVLGPLVVFFQLFWAENWVGKNANCHRVSNVCHAIVNLS